MNNRNKILVGCLALLLALSVGYALFSETVTINGTATAKGDFEITATCQTGLADVSGLYENAYNTLNATETENNYSEDSCSVVDNKVTFNTNLNAPGAMRYYTVKVTNNGTISAWAPVQGSSSTEACMGEEMMNATGVSSAYACRTKLFTSSNGLSSTSSSIGFEDFSFGFVIEKEDGTLVDLYQLMEESGEEAVLSYMNENVDMVKLESGWSLYYVGKMYVPDDYQFDSTTNMIDFNLTATYSLDFVQQTN